LGEILGESIEEDEACSNGQGRSDSPAVIIWEIFSRDFFAFKRNTKRHFGDTARQGPQMDEVRLKGCDICSEDPQTLAFGSAHPISIGGEGFFCGNDQRDGVIFEEGKELKTQGFFKLSIEGVRWKDGLD
jgi:hypothetical protein